MNRNVKIGVGVIITAIAIWMISFLLFLHQLKIFDNTFFVEISLFGSLFVIAGILFSVGLLFLDAGGV
jgi:hypothetical protein